MAIKLKIPTGNKRLEPNRAAPARSLVERASFSSSCRDLHSAGFFTYYYVKYGRIIEQRFKGPVFANSARIYAIPHAVRLAKKSSQRDCG